MKQCRVKAADCVMRRARGALAGVERERQLAVEVAARGAPRLGEAAEGCKGWADGEYVCGYGGAQEKEGCAGVGGGGSGGRSVADRVGAFRCPLFPNDSS
jgi:hypothetical protein